MSLLVHRVSPPVHDQMLRQTYSCHKISIIYDLIDKRRYFWSLFEPSTTPPYSSLDETTPLINPPPKSESSIYALSKVQPDDFRPIRLISEGASGKVYSVEDRVSKKAFALKVIRKRSDNLLQVINEKDTLCKVTGPRWFLSLEASMHDDMNFYFVTVRLQVPPFHDSFWSDGLPSY
jgi:hypothetical protein